MLYYWVFCLSLSVPLTVFWPTLHSVISHLLITLHDIKPPVFFARFSLYSCSQAFQLFTGLLLYVRPLTLPRFFAFCFLRLFDLFDMQSGHLCLTLGLALVTCVLLLGAARRYYDKSTARVCVTVCHPCWIHLLGFDRIFAVNSFQTSNSYLHPLP